MYKLSKPTIVAIAAAALFGCAPRLQTPVVAKQVAEPVAIVDAAPASFVEIAEPNNLTLESALLLALEKSPELQSFAQSKRVGEARILQANLIPNPELSLTVEDVLGNGEKTGVKGSQTTLMLSQVIELGEKRAARVGAATAYQGQLNEEYEVKRIEILSSLTDKFIRTAADAELLVLAEKGEGLAQEALSNIRKRSRAGGVSELEETKARVTLARAKITAEHAEHELLTSKRELAAFWGAEIPKFEKISTNLFQRVPFPTYEELAERIDQSPEIRHWASEKRVREADLKLAKAKGVPNLALGAGPRHIQTTQDQDLVFQVSVPLSIFDRNQGAIEEAAILKDRVAIDERVSRLQLKTTLFGLYQEAKHVQTELETMALEVLPQAERSLEIAESGYEQGRFPYLDLLDAQQTLLEVSRENIEAAYSYHSFINAIERLLGSPLNTNAVKPH